MDHDRRKKTQRAESDRRQVRKRTLNADLGQFVCRQRTEIPDEAKHGRDEQKGIEA